MNRAERRAAARHPDSLVCEHGNPKKTDGTGKPVCPHGCGFVDKPVKRHRCCGNAASGQHRPTCPRRPTKRLRRRPIGG